MCDGDKTEFGVSDRRKLGVNHGEMYIYLKVKKGRDKLK
jgi:hypothetical protein